MATRWHELCYAYSMRSTVLCLRSWYWLKARERDQNEIADLRAQGLDEDGIAFVIQFRRELQVRIRRVLETAPCPVPYPK